MSTKSLLMTAGVALAVVVAYEHYQKNGTPKIRTSN